MVRKNRRRKPAPGNTHTAPPTVRANWLLSEGGAVCVNRVRLKRPLYKNIRSNAKQNLADLHRQESIMPTRSISKCVSWRLSVRLSVNSTGRAIRWTLTPHILSYKWLQWLSGNFGDRCAGTLYRNSFWSSCVGPIFVGAPVRPNMLNMPKSASPCRPIHGGLLYIVMQ